MTVVEPIDSQPPPFAERLAVRIVQFGCVAVVLVASTYTIFDLDRFFVPKDVVLHATALLAGLLLLRRLAASAGRAPDRLLAFFVVLSALSAAFATNHWLALRAFAMSVSGIVIFWAARRLAEDRSGGRVLAGVAVAVTAAASTALLQAYGLRLGVFSINRAPGGTLGNRNFVAHAVAFGLPTLLYFALRGETRRRRFVWVALALVTSALVLTRSRAAWLAATAMFVVFICALFLGASLRRDRRIWRRLALAVVFCAAGAAAALVLPNTLRWHGRNPYLDSVRGVTAYKSGSGHARLIHYTRTLLLALRHPLLGVGPGNWPVVYPAHAAPDDPSLNPSEPRMTFNPWPSSDWIAFAAERGFTATALLALAFLSLAGSALRALRSPVEDEGGVDVEAPLAAAALLATLVAAGVAGLFDAVLLLPLPTLLVWAAAGALGGSPGSGRGLPQARRALAWPAVAACVVVAGIGAGRSTAQLMSMDLIATRGDRAALERAASLDPSNFRLQLRLARGGRREIRCEHARAAHELFPTSEAARELDARCR